MRLPQLNSIASIAVARHRFHELAVAQGKLPTKTSNKLKSRWFYARERSTCHQSMLLRQAGGLQPPACRLRDKPSVKSLDPLPSATLFESPDATSQSRRYHAESLRDLRARHASGVHRPYIIHYVQGHDHLLHPSRTDSAKPPLENTMRRGPRDAMMRADSGCDSPPPEGELHQLSKYCPELDND